MATLKLNEKTIAALPPPAGERVTYYDEALPGFALVVGKRTRVFVLKRWIGGRKRKITIGRHGAIREDGLAWNATLARQRARELLGEVAGGKVPEPAPRRGGPTLRDGLELHLENMRKRRRSARSIRTFEYDVTKYLADWLDRPIADLTGAELERICQGIMKRTKPRAGSVNPPGAALTKRLVAEVSAIWNALDRMHDLPGKNPATRVTPHALAPRQERVGDDDLAGWYAKVQTLSPVRRDLQLFTLFTGLRSESVRTLRWDDVDWDRRVLHVRKAKGDKPYTVPLCSTHFEILERRRRENAIEFSPHGGDHGWIFPSLTRSKPYEVIHVAEAKERRSEVKNGPRVNYLPGLHALRKTFNSVAIEIGIAKEQREALMNHEGQGVNAKHYGFPQTWGYLADCQERIESALWSRIRADGSEQNGR